MTNGRLSMSIWVLLITLGLAASAESLFSQASGSSARPAPDPPKGNLQRSAEILNFKRIADSGPDRGKEI